LVDAEAGAAVSVEDLRTARWDAVQAAVRSGREAEARRLWYVALTRARDYTVVVDGGRGYPLAAALPRVHWPWRTSEADELASFAADEEVSP
jgi:superfamily I DNA/RNA helicase